MAPLSGSERRIYDAIERLERRCGRRPFQREVAIEAGYRSKASANKYIKPEEQKGYLKRDYQSLGTLRLEA